MESRPTNRPAPQLVLGFLVIVLGILFTLDNLNILNAGDFLRLWPALLIIFGLMQLSRTGEASFRFLGLVFSTVGVLLLLHNLDLLHFRIWDLWPLLLVFVGVAMIWQFLQRRRNVPEGEIPSISAFALLGGVQRTCASQDFQGGELTAIMGGCEIDLREAAMQADEAVLHTFAFWGGIEIKVPETWTVIVEGFPFMGGIEELTHAPKEGPRKVLRIKGLVIMGGVEIRN